MLSADLDRGQIRCVSLHVCPNKESEAGHCEQVNVEVTDGVQEEQ